jgi:GNAT superfamily N-acetyltransferase
MKLEVPPTLTFSRTTVAHLVHNPASTELFNLHFEEVGTGAKLSIDTEPFYDCEARNEFLAVAVYDGERLVGYSINTLTQHLFYDELWCNHVAMFVHPTYRRLNVCRRLMQMVEQLATKEGCTRITMHAKPNTAMDQILIRSTYSIHETIYSMEL